MINITEEKPWSRRKGESSKSYAWFKTYRNLGPNRTFLKVIEKLEQDKNRSNSNKIDEIPVPTLKSLKNQSAKWHWVKRCRRWDNYQDELERKIKNEEYRKLEGHLIEVGTNLVEAVEKNVDELSDNLEESKAVSVAHSLASAAKAFDNGVKNLRLLYGRSTEIKDEKSEVSVDAEIDAKKEINVDLTSDMFMESELNIMKDLISDKHDYDTE